VLLGVVGLLIPAWQSGLISSQVEICQAAQENGPQYCATYPLIPGALAYVEAHNGLVTALATIIIAVFTWKLSGATDRLRIGADNQSEVTRQMFLAENRPWISVKPVIASPLIFEADGNARVEIQFLVTNVGKGPAIGVGVEAKFYVFFGDTRPLQKQVVADQKLFPQRIRITGFTLFPNESECPSISLPIEKQDMEKYWGRFGKMDGSVTAFPPVLIGCVIYGFTFEEGVHCTGFAFDLRKGDLENPKRSYMIDSKDGNLPISSLRLTYTPFSVPPD
jgi:hypothetical protein